MISTIISKAIYHYITSQIRSGGATRRFFRLDGFDDDTYKSFLEIIAQEGDTLANQPVQVRTTSGITGFEAYVCESGKSATWYRNNVPDRHALILIFNQRTTDAQSLKDIYPITESLLVEKGLDHLVRASFSDYQLNSEELKILRGFLGRVQRQLFQLQLRDLTAFLAELSQQLKDGKVNRIEAAMAESLPQLGIFRCRALADHLNHPRGDRLLKDLYNAARQGSELLEERLLNDFLARLEEAEFEDESSYGGPSDVQKRSLLHRFLTEVLTDRRKLLEVLRLDWQEVANVLHKKIRRTKEEKLQELGQAIKDALDVQQLDIVSDLSEEAQDAFQDLSDGHEPDNDTLEQLIAEQQENLGKSLSNKLRRLSKTKTHQDSDFIAGVTDLAIRLLSPYQDELPDNLSLYVEFEDKRLDKITSKEEEALIAFLTLYGGVEIVMPAIRWDLDKLWSLAKHHVVQETEEEEEGERDRVIKTTLYFRLTVKSGDDDLSRAELHWLYRSDSPAAATLANLQAEANKLNLSTTGTPLFNQIPKRLPIPIYNTCPEPENVGDLSLSSPLQTLGAWYLSSSDFRGTLRDSLDRRTKPAIIELLDKSVGMLEEAWGKFVHHSTSSGILSADLENLLTAYESLHATALENLQRGQEVNYGFRILTQAWIVGPESFDEWAVVPFIHPLKLHWWRERTSQFNQIIASLLDSSEPALIVEEARFRKELKTTYSSASYPAILALPGRDLLPAYFLPVDEVDGYELYRREDKAGIAYGLDPDLVSEEESSQAANVAADDLARVVQDYVETYPFVQDGLEIYLIDCRNSSLPGKLVERLDKISRRRDWSLRLSVVVQTTDRGAPLYNRLTDWLHENEEFAERPAERYFPQVSLKILECKIHPDLFHRLEDTDLVILPDVLAEKGQSIDTELLDQKELQDVSLIGYLPLQRTQQAPFERGEYTRDLLLNNPLQQTTLLRYFYNAQYAAEARHSISTSEAVSFRQIVSLQDWEQELNNLHKRFNWVVCYDTTIDRFLLEDTFPDTVQVIRYSLGLGPKRRHNLTVSSSYRAQDVVVRRLTTRLNELLPGTPDDFRETVAQRLVDEAKQVSGDIVLRAAGPGAYLNELIGLIMAKHQTEQRYLAQHPGALTAWIYLDDFAHWFNKKFPDLLFVAIPPEANGELPIHVEVIETKCVGESNFPPEVVDAQNQVAQGVNRLSTAWMPGAHHLDAFYWYDQFYKAVVGNLSVEHTQMRLWEAFRRRLFKGDFTLHMSGHAWAFCYDGSAGFTEDSDHGSADITAPDAPDIPHQYNYYNRTGLRKLLRQLVGEWRIEAPSDTWLPQYDEPLPKSKEELPSYSVSEVESREDISPKTFPEVEIKTVHEQDLQIDASDEVMDASTIDQEWLHQVTRELTRILRNYGLKAFPIEADKADIGPSIVRFKIRLRPGEQLSRLQRIAEDLARELRLTSIPLIDNVLGTNYVGIDVPRPEAEVVPLLPLFNKLPQLAPAELPIILGQTPDGQTIIEDLSEFPHLLVAGATNSGKSVFLRSLILCLMQRYEPFKLHLLIVDPKRTDFSFFNGLPYLLGNEVITENEKARDFLLNLVLSEMPRRQEIMAGRSMRIKEFNARYPDEALPPIVAIIDEYAQLLSIMSKKERNTFERDLMSLAAVARATGIHLILATQRPSADVVTGTLKANLPASIAFKVASAVNSRIIIDQNGAENLLGRGDMLFRRPSGEVIRLQAPFVSEMELIEILEQYKR